MSKNDEFKFLMNVIETNYNIKHLNQNQLDLFKVMIKQLGFDNFKQAITKHMMDPNKGMYFPSFANVSAHAEKPVQRLEVKKSDLPYSSANGYLSWCQNTENLKQRSEVTND